MSTEQLAGLEEQRDLLLKSLRDLEAERAAGEMGDDDYQTLKDDYTARAAAVLRAIEASRSRGRRSTAAGRTSGPGRERSRGQAPRGQTTGRPGDGRPRSGPSRTPARRERSIAITLGVAFAVIAVASISVVVLAGGRDPGQPVTGSVPGSSSSRIAEALSLETEGRAVDALKVYDEVLREEPGNVEALAYRGWLLKRAGLPDKALESLDRAVAADPTFPDAHFFRGMVLYQDKDDPAGAVVEFEAFLANDPPPDFVGAVQEVLAEAKAAAAAKASGAPAVP